MALPGLELLYASVSRQFRCVDDAVICVLHWNIISNGFKCTGIGEKPSGSKKKTELLPAGWNESSELYVLQYHCTQNNEDFVLKVIKIDESLLVHFMRVQDEKVASMSISVKDYTTGNLEDFDGAFKDLSVLNKRFKTEVLDKVVKKSNEASKKASSPKSKERSNLEDDLRSGPSHQRQRPPDWIDTGDPFAVGRGDLDPLGHGMGGMLMDPRRSGGSRFGLDPNAGLPGRLPPGAVPPGARFDPFGPQGGPGARPGPDPDHMKPPGYDDMFM